MMVMMMKTVVIIGENKFTFLSTSKVSVGLGTFM